MSFISWQYFIFLPIIIISYWLLPARRRLLLLLAGSYFFYGCWDVRFLALVLATTVIDYNCGLAIAGRKKGPWQVLGLALLPGGLVPGVLCLAARLRHLQPPLAGQRRHGPGVFRGP